MNHRTPICRAPNRRVLVVDDNSSIHSDFRKILCPDLRAEDAVAEMETILFETNTSPLEPVRFDLQHAHQGQEALELVNAAVGRSRPYSLAFVDVRMPPGWDGVETIEQLWRVDPRLQVVVCTAYSDYSWDEMRARLGQSENLVVLKKPFDNVEVQQLAHALTRKWDLTLDAEAKMDQLETMVRERTNELERAGLELARSEERFAKAFQTSPVAMAIQSLPDFRFVDANARMTQLAGYSRSDMIGRPASELFIWETPSLMDEWIVALLRNEVVHDQETQVRHRSGGLHEVLVSLSMVSISGQPHVLCVAQDVTERNGLQRQLYQAQKMEAIGQLAAGVAHDFNNILTVITGHAGLLQDQLEAAALPSRSAEEILRAANRASSLIRQLLMFSRKQIMKFRPLDLNSVVGSSLAMVGRLLGEHIRIQFSPEQGLPSIEADDTMIEQVIMNLAVNARDAMANGGQVTIFTDAVEVNRGATQFDPESRQGQYVRLAFGDTGCGMDASVLNRVFEPFFTTKGVGKGTGLGLSTVFGVVRQHRGWVEVRSKPGEGAVFYLHFPVCTLPAEATEPSRPPAVMVRGTETILVAEDEEPLREMVTHLLTLHGYTVLCAASGVEAVQVYEKANCPIDLLLTDLVMPGGILGRCIRGA